MKIFVPKYRHNFPHKDNLILTSMLVELHDREDLDNVIDHWQFVDDVPVEKRSVKKFFQTNIKSVCDHPPTKHSLEPFLRRPHVTLHGGSKIGAAHCRDIFKEGAYQSAYLAVKHGFNVWYGGGGGSENEDKDGLMGQFAKGFNEGIRDFGRQPDQYLIQVIPYKFIRGVESKDGLKAVNEGLADISDAAIIMPDFETRLHLLNSRCTGALSNPGGTGSMEEYAGIMRNIKTGLQKTPLYLLSPPIDDEFGGCYYDLIEEHIKRTVARGLENPHLLDNVYFMPTVPEIYTDLVAKLGYFNATPNEVYADYCSKYDAQPTLPLGKEQRKQKKQIQTEPS